MLNQFDPKTDPVIVVNDDEGRVVIGDLPRIISVVNLDRSERNDLEFDIERFFKRYSDPIRIDDYVYLAIAEAASDLVTKREIRAAVNAYFDDPAAVLRSAEDYCLYSVDGDESELIGKDIIDQAIDFALAYHNVCGLTGEIYNKNRMIGPWEPQAGIYLTKIGHVLKEMLFGTAEQVSIG